MVKKKIDKQDEYVTNKILAVFVLSFFLILGLLLTYNGYRSFGSILLTQKIAYGASAVLALLAAAGLIWDYRASKSHKVSPYQLFRGRNLSMAGLLAAFCAFVSAYYFIDGVKAMYIFVPVVAVLALIYMIYSTEFFVIATATTAGGFLLWLFSRASLPAISLSSLGSSKLSLAAVFYCIVLLIGLIFLFPLRRNGGDLRRSERSVKIFPKNANYPLLALSLSLTAICLLLALATGSSLAYYLIFVLFGYLFVLAVYYTVKLI